MSPVSKPVDRNSPDGAIKAAGHQSASLNALRTGAYARSLILPGEDPAHFQELLDQFMRDFTPEDMVGQAMVHELAVLTWKKLRVERLEHEGMLHRLQKPFTVLDFPSGDPLTSMVANQVRELNDHFSGLAVTYQTVARWLDGPPPLGELVRQIEASQPLLLEWMLTRLRESVENFPEVTRWATEVIKLPSGEKMPFPIFALREFIRAHAALHWALCNPDLTLERIRCVQANRVLAFIERPSGRRALDDLDRAFHRTLQGLRKHQQWRREYLEIEVNPSITPQMQSSAIGEPPESANDNHLNSKIRSKPESAKRNQSHS